MQYMTREDRLIELEKMVNTRDLGGYETQEGRYTKAKRFIRASSPSNATAKDLDTLHDYGITLTIDLRSDYEKQIQPSPFNQDERFENIEINLLDDAHVEVIPNEIKEYKDLGGVYIYTLEAHKKMIKQVFDVFLNHPYETILFHCSAGKDRTGIIAALLLELAGCHEHDIVKDYSESYSNNLKMIENLKEMMDEDTQNFLTSSPRYMLIFLNYLWDHFGSSKAYLLSLGFTEEEIDDIKQSFLI